MSVTKKYIGESQLKGDPKKTLGFKIKDGTITTDKLVDGSITSPKLSDDLQTLLKKIEDLYPTVKMEELDTLGGLLTTHKEAIALTTQTEKSRFVVMGAWSSSIHVAGILDIVSDAAGHVLTEVLTTHQTMTDGVLSDGEHSDGILYQYFRSYNVSSPTLTGEGLAIDSWTKWQRLDTYTLNEVTNRIADTIPQMIDGIAATVDDLPSTKGLYYYVTSEGSFYWTNGKSSKGIKIDYPALDAKLLYVTKSTNKIYRWTEADGMILLADFSALGARVTTLESSVKTVENKVATVEKDVTALESSVETDKKSIAAVKESVEAIESSIGAPGGIAQLDENQQLEEFQLPREKIDEVLEFDGFIDFTKVSNAGINGKVYFSRTLNTFASTNATFPIAVSNFGNVWNESEWFGTLNPGSGVTPYEGKIYIDRSTNIPYRWDGTTLVAMTSMSSGGTDMTASYDDGYLTLEWSNS